MTLIDCTFREELGGRGFLQIRLTVEEEIRNLSEYISSSTESALKEVITEGLLTVEDTKKDYKRKEMMNRQEKRQNKVLHSQYLNDTDRKTDCEITWNWLKNGYLKKEMEGQGSAWPISQRHRQENRL